AQALFHPALDIGAEQHQQAAYQGQGDLREVAAAPARNGREQVKYQVHGSSSGQEILQQVIEEQLASRRCRQSIRFDLQKALSFGLAARLGELLQRQAGAQGEKL